MSAAALFAFAIVGIVVAFLLGSIPFGFIVGRFFYSTDIRTQGSGNIGTMNALRTLGKTGAAIVLVLDVVKGALPVLIGRAIFGANDPAAQWMLAAFATAAVLGHCFSPWLGWKGGKGVATSLGAIFALSWPAGMVFVLTWILGGLIITQYSSVGSMLASIVAPLALWRLTESVPFALYGLFAAIFIVWTHRENVVRLRAGSENRISLFRGKGSGRAGPYHGGS